MSRKSYAVLLAVVVVVATVGGLYFLNQQPATNATGTPASDPVDGVQQSNGSIDDREQSERKASAKQQGSGLDAADRRANGQFAVTNISAPGQLKMGDTIAVEATIANLGQEPTTRTAQYILAGERYQERAVTLDPDESTTIRFEQNTMGIGLETGGYYTGVLVGDNG